MLIEIDSELKEALQEFTTLKLGPEELRYFVDFFLWIGIGTVREVLARHPELTFGDLVMLRLRINRC